MARMRLRERLRPRPRSRALRALPSDWVQPRGSGRWTTIGNLDSPYRAAVDPSGLVTVEGAPWSLDWWVGAEDRWHLPAQEVAVRQALLGGSPVVETRVRVPSGDAVQRAYAGRTQAGAEAVVVELENQSKVPFAVALAVRPHGQSAQGAIAQVSLDGNEVRIDGRLAVVLPRSPGRIAFGTERDGDAAQIVMDGRAEEVRAGQVDCTGGLAHVALLFPLAHTAMIRVVLPLGTDAPIGIDELPGPTDVATGWGTQAGRGARFELPDRRLRDAYAASVRHVLLGERSVETAMALDLAGFPDEAELTLVSQALDLASADRPGLTLQALARHWELTRDVAFAAAVVDLVATLVPRLPRRGDDADRAAGVRATYALIALLEAAGESRAAADLAELGGSDGEVTGGDPDPAADSLTDLLAAATGTWSWPGPDTGHDPAANAQVIRSVRDRLLREVPDGILLAPAVPEPWLGQGWEVHAAPTSFGRVSYAVRWHGDRPALLWELDAHDGLGAAPVMVRVPGLDPGWSTTEPSGEALLAPVALPEKGPRKGISMPVTIEPMIRRSDG